MPRTADTKHIPRRFIKTICSRGNINIYTDIYRYLHRYLDTWISSNRHQHSQSSTVDRGQQLAMAVAPSSKTLLKI